jgi:hypothetical protein
MSHVACRKMKVRKWSVDEAGYCGTRNCARGSTSKVVSEARLRKTVSLYVVEIHSVL